MTFQSVTGCTDSASLIEDNGAEKFPVLRDVVTVVTSRCRALWSTVQKQYLCVCVWHTLPDNDSKWLCHWIMCLSCYIFIAIWTCTAVKHTCNAGSHLMYLIISSLVASFSLVLDLKSCCSIYCSPRSNSTYPMQHRWIAAMSSRFINCTLWCVNVLARFCQPDKN